MAKQTLNITLTGESGLAGNLSQEVWQTTPDLNLNYTVDEGEMASGIYNPLMRPGYLFPANDSFLTIETPSINNDFTSAFTDSSAGVIIACADSNIYVPDVSFVNGPATYNYSVMDFVKMEAVDLGTNSVYDMISYVVNDNKKIFFINSDDVGIMDDDFTNIDPDWLTTVATGGDDLRSSLGQAFFVPSDNGLLYIVDVAEVHHIDGTAIGGTNGLASMSVLVFPRDMMRIVDAVDTRGKMFFAINSNIPGVSTVDDITQSETYLSSGGVWIWNRISTSLSVQDYVTVENCNRILRIWVGSEGNIFLMTIGTNGANQIRVYDGSKFTIIKELPFETKIMNRKGLLVAEGMTIWAAVDGYIYMGRMNGNKYSVFKVAQYFSNPSTLESVVMTFSGGSQFDSNSGFRTMRPSLTIAYSRSGFSEVIKRYFIYGIDSMTDTNGSDGSGYISPNPFLFTPNRGDVYTGVYLLPTLANVYDVVIRCIPTPTGATEIATIKYYFNNSSTASITKTVTLNHASKGYVSHAINKQNINSIQIEIEWKTAVTMGTSTFAPYIASVSYEKTDTYSGSDV